MAHTLATTLDDLEVHVEYEPEPYDPGSYSEPPSGGGAVLQHVWLGTAPKRVDILPVLDADLVDGLQERADDDCADEGPLEDPNADDRED